jgi:redox-sensitive bicupin YhaK (pirin superfamily)
MLQLRKSQDRGFAQHGWLKSHHSFSFANYYDPKHMGFHDLRVINEDYIEGGKGFGSHPHHDMEIITYVVKGALQHKDSMGTTAIIRPGEVQRMSAASGVVHSEYNADPNEEVHLLQIWIMPNERGGKPSYGQKSFEEALNTQKMVLVVSGDARDGSIGIKQDADLYISRLKNGDDVEFQLRPKRGAWIQVVKGEISVNDAEISKGDALAIESGELLTIKALVDSEFLLFDLN